MRSNYLDKMISEISKEVNKSSIEEGEYIKEQITYLEKSWNRKKKLENIIIPVLSVIVFIYVYLSFKGTLFFTNIIPVIIVCFFSILMKYKNNKINAIDLSLDLTNYGKKQTQILKDQILYFKWFKTIGYPLITASIIWEFIFYLQEQTLRKDFIIIILKIIILGGLIWHEKKSVKEISLEIENLN